MQKPDWWPRFEAKFNVDETTGCWLWTASQFKHGYGRFRLDGRTLQAHRVAYEALIGPVPEGLELDHVKARGCQGPACVNPAHLEPVTHAENIRRVYSVDTGFCGEGHRYTPENTGQSPDLSRRWCKACKRLRTRATRAKVRLAA